MHSDAMDAVFRALANESRRRLLDIVKDRPGCSVSHVAGYFDESRINVMKHLRVLEEAGLIHLEKQGRTRKLDFNCVPIQLVHEGWTPKYSSLGAGRLTKAKYQFEVKRAQDDWARQVR